MNENHSSSMPLADQAIARHVVVIEGQSIEVPPEVAASDDLLRAALAPYFPAAASAEVQRIVAAGPDGVRTQTITIVKRAGPKGV